MSGCQYYAPAQHHEDSEALSNSPKVTRQKDQNLDTGEPDPRGYTLDLRAVLIMPVAKYVYSMAIES